VFIITWDEAHGFSKTTKTADGLYCILIKVKDHRWEPLVQLLPDSTLTRFNEEDLEVIFQKIEKSVSQKEIIGDWDESIIHETMIEFSDEIGTVLVTEERPVDIIDLSREDIETKLFGTLPPETYLKRTVKAYAESIINVLYPTLEKDTHYIPIIDGKIKKSMDDTYLEERFIIRKTKESYQNRQRRLAKAGVPFENNNGLSNWTIDDKDTDALLDDTVPIRCLGKSMNYEGDDISLQGLARPGTPFDTVSLDEYVNTISQMEEGDDIIIRFQAPYYKEDGSLQENELKGRISNLYDMNIQIELPYSLRAYNDTLSTNMLFYKTTERNDVLIFSMNSNPWNRIGGPLHILRGEQPVHKLFELAIPSRIERIYFGVLDERFKFLPAQPTENEQEVLNHSDWFERGVGESAKLDRHNQPVKMIDDDFKELYQWIRKKYNIDPDLHRLYELDLFRTLYKVDQVQLLYLHLYSEQIKAYKEKYPNLNVDELRRSLVRLEKEREQEQNVANVILNVNELDLKQEYENIEALSKDQDKLIVEWEGTYATCTNHYSSKIRSEKPKTDLYYRHHYQWVNIGTLDSERRVSIERHLNAIRTLYIDSAEKLLENRDYFQKQKEIETLHRIIPILEGIRNVPSLEKHLSEAELPKELAPERFIYHIQKAIDPHILEIEEEWIYDIEDILDGYSDWMQTKISDETSDVSTQFLNSILSGLNIQGRIPEDDSRAIIENIPDIMSFIVDGMYRHKEKERSKSKAALDDKKDKARGYKQKLMDLYPDTKKREEFENKTIITIIASFISIIIRVLPELELPGPYNPTSYSIVDLHTMMAALLNATYTDLMKDANLSKMLGDLHKIILSRRPIYQARIDATPVKEMVPTSSTNKKNNRFRPPLRPVQELSRFNDVSVELQSIYGEVSKQKPLKRYGNRITELNSCCLRSIQESESSVVSKEVTSIPAEIQVNTKMTSVFRDRNANESMFLPVSRKKVHHLKWKETSTKIEAPFDIILNTNALLDQDPVFKTKDANEISIELKDLFTELWDITRSLSTPANDLYDKLESYIIKADVSVEQYPSFIRAIDSFSKYDIRRIVGRSWFGNMPLAGANKRSAEFILENIISIPTLIPIHNDESDMSDTIYVYHYRNLKTMYYLLWSLVVDDVKKNIYEDDTNWIAAISSSVRQGVNRFRVEERVQIGEVFLSMWTQYIETINRGMLSYVELRQIADTSREQEKLKNMMLKKNTAVEEHTVIDSLKAMGLIHLVKTETPTVDITDPANSMPHENRADQQLDAAIDVTDIDNINQDINSVIDPDYVGENDDDDQDD